MAISLGFGVLYASIMTLILVPVGYVILDDLIRLTSRADPESRSEVRVSDPSMA
jgi:hypothetical protein